MDIVFPESNANVFSSFILHNGAKRTELIGEDYSTVHRILLRNGPGIRTATSSMFFIYTKRKVSLYGLRTVTFP